MPWQGCQEFLIRPKCCSKLQGVSSWKREAVGRTTSSGPSRDSRIIPGKYLNLDLCLIKYFNPLLEQGSGPKMVPSCMVLRTKHEVYNLDFWNNMKYLKEDAGKTTKNTMKRFSHQRAWEQSQSMTKDFPELRRQFYFLRSLSMMSNSYESQYHILVKFRPLCSSFLGYI